MDTHVDVDVGTSSNVKNEGNTDDSIDNSVVLHEKQLTENIVSYEMQDIESHSLNVHVDTGAPVETYVIKVEPESYYETEEDRYNEASASAKRIKLHQTPNTNIENNTILSSILTSNPENEVNCEFDIEVAQNIKNESEIKTNISLSVKNDEIEVLSDSDEDQDPHSYLLDLQGSSSSESESDDETEEDIKENEWIPFNGPLEKLFLRYHHKKQFSKPWPLDPYEYFRLFIDDDLLDLIVEETNKKAELLFDQSGVSENLKSLCWQKLTREELLIFIGLLIHTGTVRLQKISDYWKKHWLFNMTCFSNFMSRNRFVLILKCLDFAADVDEQCISKVDPIVNHFNNKMNSVYNPDRTLIINEVLAIYKGKLFFRDFLKIKQLKGAHRICVLAEPEGIVVKFLVLSGHPNEKKTSKEVVCEILKEKLYRGHSVYLDKIYTSYSIARWLLDNETYCTGKLTKCLEKLHTNLENRVLKSNGNYSVFRDGIHIGKFTDHRDTYYITTEHDNCIVLSKGTRHQSMKPIAIEKFDKARCNMNAQDKMSSFYPSVRPKQWYKKIFIHMIQMSLCNAYHLYNAYHTGRGKMKVFEFRLFLLEKILPEQIVKDNRKQKLAVGDHILTKIEKFKLREKKEGEGSRTVKEVTRKECRLCRSQKKRTSTLYECRSCAGSPGYCMDCFWKAHS